MKKIIILILLLPFFSFAQNEIHFFDKEGFSIDVKYSIRFADRPTSAYFQCGICPTKNGVFQKDDLFRYSDSLEVRITLDKKKYDGFVIYKDSEYSKVFVSVLDKLFIHRIKEN